MDFAVGLEHLPIDAVEYIVNHLTDTDILKCTLVSRTWYNIFSNDIIWKKKCNKKQDDYLASTECQVEPFFKTPQFDDRTLPLRSTYKLYYMREKHLLKNWRTLQFKREEIEFDCDGSISYNIKVEFVANDFVFLHTTFQTEIWDVTKKPYLAMTIPFNLKELWEQNVYRVLDNNTLVVVQCNVVQVFNFCLLSKTWSLTFVFFFNKPYDFSAHITAETDIDAIFQVSSFSTGEQYVCVVCKNYLVGYCTDEESLKTPVMHIWDVKTGKKVKEQQYPGHLNNIPSSPRSIDLKVSESLPYAVVLFESSDGSCFVVYNLFKLDFLFTIIFPASDFLLCGEYLCLFNTSSLLVLNYCSNENQNDLRTKKHEFKYLEYVRILNNTTLLVLDDSNIIRLDLNSGKMSVLFVLDFLVYDIQIIQEMFILFKGHLCSIWEIRDVDQINLHKLFGFTPYDMFDLYRAVNESLTKVVLENCNTLFILNFW